METKTLVFCSKDELEGKLKAEVKHLNYLSKEYDNAKQKGLRTEFWSYMIGRSQNVIDRMKSMLNTGMTRFCYTDTKDMFEIYSVNELEL